LQPKKFKDKWKQKIVASTHQNLGSNFGYESNVMDIGSEDISSINSNSSFQSSKMESDIDQKKMREIFHVRVIVKHTKIDSLFDIRSQFNLLFEAIVNKLVLNMTPEKNSYPLGWVCDDAKL
jgi:hypothetical protein